MCCKTHAQTKIYATFGETYLRHADNPPLSTSLPLRPEPYGHRHTHAWFDALLPEGVRREHLARIANAASLQTWELLHAAGGECAGAVRILGDDHRTEKPRTVVMDADDLYHLLKNTPIEPIGSLSRAARLSLAGAQQKTALYRTSGAQWALSVGGHPSSHILKPQSTRFESLVENEHYCMTLARHCGIDAARTHMEHLDDLAVLVIERYDRIRTHDGAIEHIHQEDLAQALGQTYKYESEGGAATGDLFTVPGVHRDALFERIMFNWIIGNCDAHTKNYSILEPGTPRARLAPAYDVLSTECYAGLSNTLATTIGEASTLNEVDEHQVEALGIQIGYAPGHAAKRLRDLAERIRDAVRALDQEGITPGPVRTDIIEKRTGDACNWAKRE